MSIIITCDSRLNKNIFPNNRFSNFSNIISPINCEDGDWYIALLFIKVSFKESEVRQYNYAGIHLSEVMCYQGRNNISDSCIYQALYGTKYPHHIRNPTYYPLKRVCELNQLTISVRNDDWKESTLSDHCVMSFHLQKNLLPPTKILRTFSNIQNDLFPKNTPFHFVNTISPLFYDNIDFNQWEIALESIIIDKVIMQKLYETYEEPDCLSIYIDVIKDQVYGDRMTKLLGIYPINKKSMNFDRTLGKIVSTFMYAPYSLTFIPMIKSVLDKIEIRITIDYAKLKNPQTSALIFSEEEKKALCNVNLILRKK